VLALGTTIAAIGIDKPAGLLALGIVAVAGPAAAARLLSRVARTSLLLALPLALSALVVNALFAPGHGDALLALGPLRITEEGLRLGLLVVARVLVIAGGVTLFTLTTRPSELVADLERRGLPARVTFVLAAVVGAIPALAERASLIVAAQRARGLDTEGGLRRRARGILPLVGPALLASIGQAEARAVALEARAFSRPGPRTLLWTPPDTRLERAGRWGIAGALALLVASRLLGSG
jgi:energy-coupling factor transport system permease protein